MAAVMSASPMHDIDLDKLTYEIFSVLENKFLFGYENDLPLPNPTSKLSSHSGRRDLISSCKHNPGAKVRILSIDGRGSTDGILAAATLSRFEDFLRRKSGNPDARISDFFDVVAGSGAGGILASLLFTRGRDGAPMFTADQALKFLVNNHRKIFRSSPSGVLRRIIRSDKAERLFRKTFGESTLKDTLKSVLIPCYDLSTNAPFLFSRADALEMDGYDFKIRDVCAATLTARPVEIASVDRRTRINALNGEIAMNNPTAAAITHVLHNKLEFPLCNGVEDLLVVSLGNAQSESGIGNITSSPTGLFRIAGEGASDVVDQAVSMAFGQWRTSNYVRIQANGPPPANYKRMDLMALTENMLVQKNVESVLFHGRRMVENTNLEKLEMFAGEVIKEQERRKTSIILPTVVLKQASAPSPRTSSATTLSTPSC
ncbi:patatin-like protein 6 isoform X2 [Juglans microcarpa x Juglans regia]|uniref:patatin-like protein 6 isoform X2 n=1 Tax=Juglans microcarpa x Juglans regia TaxID=2249226 RepID=UPI001B7DFACB|nr:patatin-like protein 6 isoform X2 [Juglans microcarpa x Juglans regia]